MRHNRGGQVWGKEKRVRGAWRSRWTLPFAPHRCYPPAQLRSQAQNGWSVSGNCSVFCLERLSERVSPYKRKKRLFKVCLRTMILGRSERRILSLSLTTPRFPDSEVMVRAGQGGENRCLLIRSVLGVGVGGVLKNK